MITQKYLKSILHYDPETGYFTWLSSFSNRTEGLLAGTNHIMGYWCVCVHNKKYLAHRLAWLYMTGEWPKNEIDHKDNNRANNRWDNLRVATRQDNTRNRKAYNKLGIKGVYEVRKGIYVAKITIDKKVIHLGTFDNIEDAKDAYDKVAIAFHGSFIHNSIEV